MITVQSIGKNAYSEYHLNIIRNLAAYASIAIENASLYESMEEEVKSRTIQLEQSYNNIELLN